MHSPTSSPNDDQPSLPNQPFFSWLRGQTTLFISQIAAILTLIYFLTALVYYVIHAGHQGIEIFSAKTVMAVVDYVHILVIGLFILVSIRYLDDNTPGSYRVKSVFVRVFKGKSEETEANHPTKGKPTPSVKRLKNQVKLGRKRLRIFKRRFLMFWCAMLALYVIFGLDHTYEWVTSRPTQPSHATQQHASPASDHAQASSQGTLRKVVVDITYEKTLPPKPPNDPKAKVESHRKIFSILEFALNNLSLFFVYWCFLAMYWPPNPTKANKTRERWHLGLSIAFIVVLTALFPLVVWWRAPSQGDFRAINAVFDALSGTINALVLALLIARLDSKLIGLSSRLIGVLYFYAAVQPLFVAFSQGPEKVMEEITAFVLIFVLVSKIYFFLIIMYALQTGRMLNYLVCFPELRRRAARHLKAVNHPRKLAAVAALKSVGRELLKNPKAGLSTILRSDGALTVSKYLGSASMGVFLIFLIGHVTRNELNPASNPQDVSLSSVATHIAQLIVVGLISVTLWLLRNDNSSHLTSVSKTADKIFKEKPDGNKYSPQKAEEHVGAFKKYFLWFWIATWLLYVVMLLDEIQVWLIGTRLIAGPAIGTQVFPFLTFSLGSVNLLFLFWCFAVLHSPAYDQRSIDKRKLLNNYSRFVIGLLIAGFLLVASFAVGYGFEREKLINYATVFFGFTGMLSGVGLALLIARFDSKLFNLRSSLTMHILFAYAAIQTLFVVFSLEEGVFESIEAAVLMAALGLKASFFLVIAHTLQSGKMLNYLVCFPFLRDRVDSIFENQFEIRVIRTSAKSKPFTFSVLKKNAVVYTTYKKFKTRKGCDRAILELRRAVQRINAKDQPDEVAGTYWIEIRDGRELICESVPLRSKKDRKELIEESKEMIPHCKYSRA